MELKKLRKTYFALSKIPYTTPIIRYSSIL